MYISEGKTLSTMYYVSSSASQSSTPETKETGDMLYMPHNEPKNHQVMFDTLKKYGIQPNF